jgi:transcriptional regulator of acetoin/glycerol metabolism
MRLEIKKNNMKVDLEYVLDNLTISELETLPTAIHEYIRKRKRQFRFEKMREELFNCIGGKELMDNWTPKPTGTDRIVFRAYMPDEVKEIYTLSNQEKKLIKKVLEKHNGKRKLVAGELGISERTLYRKIKEFNL